MTKITGPGREMAAKLTDVERALARLCSSVIAERERSAAMQADLQEIDRLCECFAPWSKEHEATRKYAVATIAAKYRAETDPLVETLAEIGEALGFGKSTTAAAELYAELARRGLELVKRS